MMPRRVVLVSGLSGAGRASILRTLEDMGYEAIDNPPLTLTEELVTCTDVPLAIGLDTRTRGFDAAAVLTTLERLRMNPALQPELVFAWAEEPALLRRFTETRRRHPLAPHGRVSDGIAREVVLTARLREAADLVIDTSDTPLPALRRLVEERFALSAPGAPCLTVSLMSFAYPRGLPREADMVFDARFLRNPHYIQSMRRRTGLDADVAAYVDSDPDFPAFFGQIESMLALLLPRFVQEGKRYVTIAVGCTGGRHRSVRLVEKLAEHLTCPSTAPAIPGAGLDRWGWPVTVMHRELSREGISSPTDTPQAAPFQAQEA